MPNRVVQSSFYCSFYQLLSTVNICTVHESFQNYVIVIHVLRPSGASVNPQQSSG